MKILIAFLLLLALGLTSAAPRFPYNFPFEPTDLGGIDAGTQGTKNAVENEAKSQVISAAILGTVLPIILPPLISVAKRLAKSVVCEELAQLQEYTDNKEKDAKIMALAAAMGDFLTAKEMDKFKQLNAKDDRVARAELFDWAKQYLCN